MARHPTGRDLQLLWATLPLMVVVFVAHVHETQRTGLAQLPVFAKWNPGDYPEVAGYRLETDSSGSGLLPGDRLIRIGDRDLRGVGYTGFHAIGLARTTPGHPVPLVFERDGLRRTIPLEARPHPQRWSRVPILLLIPIVCGLFLIRAPGQPDVQRFYLCFMTYAIGQAQFYGGPEWKSWLAAGIWNVASPAMLFFMLRFVRLFPAADMPESQRVPAALPWIATAFFVVCVRLNYVIGWPLPLAWVPRVSYASHGVLTIVGVGVLAWNYAHATLVGRRRIRWILLGTALGSVPVVFATLVPLAVPGWEGFRQVYAIGFLSSAIWMMGAVFGTVRDNAFDVDRLISATAAWSLAAAGAVVGLAGVVPTLSVALSETMGLDATTMRLALAAVLGALVIPVGLRVRPHVERILFPGRVQLQEGGARLVEELAQDESPERLLRDAARGSATLFDARGFALYVRRGDVLVLEESEDIDVPASIAIGSGLPRRVRPQNVPDVLAPNVTQVAPIRLEEPVHALIALGPKRSGDIYTNDDATILGTIAARVETRWLFFEKRAADRESLEKTNLLAVASHDLRQPLHAVSLLTEALRERLDDPEIQDLVARIGDSTHDLDTMLNGLLDRSQLDVGGIRPEMADVALSEVLASIERDFGLPAESQDIRLRVVPTRLAVRSDRLLLARILRNLVSNALRYAGPGARVLVGARPRGDRVVIEVRDSGPGIAADDHRRIFEAFHQLTGAARGGLGLGLSIVEGLCRLLGHEVTLRSAPGRGSTFVVSLQRVEPRAVRRDAAVGPPAPEPLLKRVLVVDDDPAVREATRTILETWGCELRSAADAGGARRALADGWRPDLVLADYDLGPGETGLDVIASLRAMLGEVRAALLTADASQQVEARECGTGDPVLRKPVRPARLRALLGGGTGRR